MRRSEASIFDLGQTEALESDDMSPCPDANASPAIKLSSHRIPAIEARGSHLFFVDQSGARSGKSWGGAIGLPRGQSSPGLLRAQAHVGRLGARRELSDDHRRINILPPPPPIFLPRLIGNGTFVGDAFVQVPWALCDREDVITCVFRTRSGRCGYTTS